MKQLCSALLRNSRDHPQEAEACLLSRLGVLTSNSKGHLHHGHPHPATVLELKALVTVEQKERSSLLVAGSLCLGICSPIEEEIEICKILLGLQVLSMQQLQHSPILRSLEVRNMADLSLMSCEVDAEPNRSPAFQRWSPGSVRRTRVSAYVTIRSRYILYPFKIG